MDLYFILRIFIRTSAEIGIYAFHTVSLKEVAYEETETLYYTFE